jgi:hypothetical protein
MTVGDGPIMGGDLAGAGAPQMPLLTVPEPVPTANPSGLSCTAQT